MTEPMKVGIIGCGNISQAYFNGCGVFPILKVVSCADINMDAANAKAAERLLIWKVVVSSRPRSRWGC